MLSALNVVFADVAEKIVERVLLPEKLFPPVIPRLHDDGGFVLES